MDLNCSLSADNLFTYAPHWVGLDPETNQGLNCQCNTFYPYLSVFCIVKLLIINTMKKIFYIIIFLSVFVVFSCDEVID